MKTIWMVTAATGLGSFYVGGPVSLPLKVALP